MKKFLILFFFSESPPRAIEGQLLLLPLHLQRRKKKRKTNLLFFSQYKPFPPSLEYSIKMGGEEEERKEGLYHLLHILYFISLHEIQRTLKNKKKKTQACSSPQNLKFSVCLCVPFFSKCSANSKSHAFFISSCV